MTGCASQPSAHRCHLSFFPVGSLANNSLLRLSRTAQHTISGQITWSSLSSATNGAFPLHGTHGTVRFGTVQFWGVFHWVLYLVPGTFLVPPRRGSKRAVPLPNVTCKLYWSLIGRRESSLLRHWTCDTIPSSTALPARFKSAQPSKDRTQLLFNKRTFLHQPQNSSVVVCWGSTDVPLVDSEERIQWELDGTTPKEKALCITLLLNCYISEYVFCLYFYLWYLCFASIKNNLIE